MTGRLGTVSKNAVLYRRTRILLPPAARRANHRFLSGGAPSKLSIIGGAVDPLGRRPHPLRVAAAGGRERAIRRDRRTAHRDDAPVHVPLQVALVALTRAIGSLMTI